MITVPVRGTGALPEDYAALWELIATAPKPLTCKDLCAQLGFELLPKNTEGLRSKLKRMVERGWLAEERPGKFTAAGQGMSRG
jgi:benzoyl-CoA reductase/2-hydroxyglutaryl-CoA dehydratase subunit BcrC/BadD/HgdB